jgi:hypothetical protein
MIALLTRSFEKSDRPSSCSPNPGRPMECFAPQHLPSAPAACKTVPSDGRVAQRLANGYSGSASANRGVNTVSPQALCLVQRGIRILEPCIYSFIGLCPLRDTGAHRHDGLGTSRMRNL